MTAGTVIAQLPITPCYSLYNQTTADYFNVTALEHVATPFCFWRGGITYTLQFVGPPMANMRIGIATRYGRFDELPTINTFSHQYAKVFNYGEENTVTFTVDYISPQDWCRVPVYDPLGSARTNPWDYAIGMIYIMVLSPYQVNETMFQAMDMNTFIAAAPDFEVKTPGENLARLAFYDAGLEDGFKPPKTLSFEGEEEKKE